MSGAEIPAAMAAMEGAAAAGAGAGAAGAGAAGAAGAGAAGAGAAGAGMGAAGLGAAEAGLGAFGAAEGLGALGAAELGSALATELTAAELAGGLLASEAVSPMASGGLEAMQGAEALKAMEGVYNPIAGANMEFAPGMYESGMVGKTPGFFSRVGDAFTNPKNMASMGQNLAKMQGQKPQQVARAPQNYASGAGTESRGQARPFTALSPYPNAGQFGGFNQTIVPLSEKLRRGGLLGAR